MSSSTERPPQTAEDVHNQAKELDLVGGPFAVIESDPGVFTTLTRKLGVKGIELVELYDIEPWAVDHLNPHGLIFCFLWRKDNHRPTDFDDPAAERVWFANQLSDDACATHALLNILLNSPNVDIGEELRTFKLETAAMSPEMKGLAITNSHLIREAHNSFSRPADLRGAVNALATTTLDQAEAQEKAFAKAAKEKEKEKEAATAARSSRNARSPPKKRARRGKRPESTSPEPSTDSEIEERRALAKKRAEQKEKKAEAEKEDMYHFIAYVPAFGKVWELDGLKSGPLEVGELSATPPPVSDVGNAGAADGEVHSTKGWMDVARPALRMKMEKYGGSADGGDNIKFSLLAMVDGQYEKASDELQLLLRKKAKLEKCLREGWETKVDPALITTLRAITERMSSDKTFAPDFGSRRMVQDKEIMDMSSNDLMLLSAWVTCAADIVRANINVEDELAKAARANTDHIKRTWDYERFLCELVKRLDDHGDLKPLLGLDEHGKKIPKAKPKATTRAKK